MRGTKFPHPCPSSKHCFGVRKEKAQNNLSPLLSAGNGLTSRLGYSIVKSQLYGGQGEGSENH